MNLDPNLQALAEAGLPDGFSLRLHESEATFALTVSVHGPIMSHSTALTDVEMTSGADVFDALGASIRRSVEVLRENVAERFGIQPAIDATARRAALIEVLKVIKLLDQDLRPYELREKMIARAAELSRP